MSHVKYVMSCLSHQCLYGVHEANVAQQSCMSFVNVNANMSYVNVNANMSYVNVNVNMSYVNVNVNMSYVNENISSVNVNSIKEYKDMRCNQGNDPRRLSKISLSS